MKRFRQIAPHDLGQRAGAAFNFGLPLKPVDQHSLRIIQIDQRLVRRIERLHMAGGILHRLQFTAERIRDLSRGIFEFPSRNFFNPAHKSFTHKGIEFDVHGQIRITIHDEFDFRLVDDQDTLFLLRIADRT